MRVRTVAVALSLFAAMTVMAAEAATDDPRRPPLRLPAASAFPTGPCRDAAAAVLALGRFTYEHTGAQSLPADAYPFLRRRAEDLAAVRDADSAGQALSARIDAVLTAIGFLRLRPGKAYDPALLRDLEAARADLQQTCVRQA